METDSPVIKPLTQERQKDFLEFMEGAAFADNPKWQSCFCQFLYVDHRVVNWQQRTAQENRAAACERICSRTMQGLLAYRAGAVVGWCNAAPRTMMDAFLDEPIEDAETIGQITCFVVAKEHRNSRVATTLLGAACEALRAQGMTIAEAMPKPELAGDAENHYGPMRMFLGAGFKVHRKGEHDSVYVRKQLA